MTFRPGKESISNKKAHGDQTGWRGWVSPEGIWRDQKVAKDGRDEEQQKAFEQVEVKPQAIEWAFSIACDFKFNFSLDNLNGAPADILGF